MYKLISYLFFLWFLLGASHASHGQSLSDQEQVAFSEAYIDACKQRLLGNPQEALDLYRKCLEIDPKNDAVFYDIGKLYRSQNNMEGVLYHFSKASELDPQNKWYLLDLAKAQTEFGQFKAADKSFQALRNISPQNPEYILNHANLLLNMGKEKKAMKAFDLLESITGPNPDVSMRKYRYYVGQNEMDKAEAELLALIEAFPEEPGFYSLLADLYKAQGAFEKAVDVHRKALRIDPDNPFVQLSLAEFYERNGLEDSAYFYIRKSFVNKGLNIDKKVGLVLGMYEQSQHDPVARSKSIELCSLIVVAHPEEPKSHSVYADFLYLDQQLAKARDSYVKTTELDPSKFAVWSQLLLIDSELEDVEAIKTHSEAAIEYFPAQPSLYWFNGIANNQLGHHDAAAKSLRNALPLIISNPALKVQVLASLGDACHELGEHRSSDSAFTEALKIEPGNAYVLNNYSYFLSLRGEHLELAEIMAKQAVDQQPNNASYLDTYGWVLFKMGRYERAAEQLQKALNNGGMKSAEVLEHYGDVLNVLGKTAEAKEYWKLAIEAGGSSETIESKLGE